MKKLVMLVIVPILIGGIFCYRGGAFAEHTGPDRYNNEDLEKYGKPEDAAGKTAPNVSDKIANEKKSEDGETREKEYWCRQGTDLNRKIDEAKNEIDGVLEKFPEKRGEDIDKMELHDEIMQERLNVNRQKLREAESALSDLEELAYRRGVPIGWIRCNFE